MAESINYLKALRLFSRNVRLILVSIALFGFTFFGVFATLFNLYLLRLGHSLEFIGLSSGVAGLAYGLSCLPAGALGRRLGGRRVMIAGMGVLMAGLVSASLTELLPATWQRGWVLTANVLIHLGFALYFVNIAPVLMASTSPEERNHAFSTEFALVLLGGFAGSLVGGLLPGLFARISSGSLEQPAPYRHALLAASLCLTLAFSTLWAVRGLDPEKTQKQEGERAATSYALFVVMGLFYFLWIVAGQGIRTFFNVYLDESLSVPTAQIGALLAVAQLLSVPATLAMPVLSVRWGQERTIVLTAGGTGLGILALAVIPHQAAAGLGYLTMIVMAAITRPVVMVFSQQLVTPKWRPVMSGSISTIAGLGMSAASTAAGYVVSAHGYGVLFGACTGVITVGTLLFWGYFCTSHGKLACRPAGSEPG